MFNANTTSTNESNNFNPPFGKRNGPMEVEFTAAMNGSIVLYRGVDRVWLGDGTGTYEGYPDYGVLYADLVDGKVVTVGPVNGYYYAVKSGFTGTYEEWIAIITNTAQTAAEIATIRQTLENLNYDAEAWAVGQRNGIDVPTTDITYHNNAKYYAGAYESMFATPATNEDIDALFGS